MDKFKNVMVCLDLSNMDNLLLGYLKFLSERVSISHIHVTHVVEEFNLDKELLKDFPDLEISEGEEFQQLIQKELRSKVDKHFNNTDVSVNISLLEGQPTKSILRELNSVDADLLILGKKTQYKGQGILSRKIARYAHTSVLFVPETVTYSLNRILVPLQFKKPSAKAVTFAHELSDVSGTDIVLQHVYEYPTQYFPYMPSESHTKKMEAHLQKKFKRFLNKYNLPDHDCILTPLKEGKNEDEIYNLSIQEQTDLIITGARGKSNTAALLIEEKSERMANYNFRVPLLIYKDKSEHQGLLQTMLEELS